MSGARAETLLRQLTPEQQVGQLFLIRCPQEEEEAVIRRYQPGGLVLFSIDFEDRTVAQCQSRMEALQRVSRVPMIVSADEEGGTVCRVSRQKQLRREKFPAPRAIYAAGGWDALEADCREKCALLRQVGVNVNLAPVCDLSDDPSHFIYPRSISGDPAMGERFAREMTELSRQCGVGTVLKHFPGYGGNADTHVGLSRDPRPLEQFRRCDLRPFAAGARAGCGAVMMSHNIVECVDGSRPASLSAPMHALLRQELGFDGVVITDDLKMDAVSGFWKPEEAAVQAVLCGNDMLCVSDWQTQLPAVLQAAEDGSLPAARLQEACLRVLRWKEQLGLL